LSVLTEVMPVPAWRSTLAVDLDDSFFFDHPLDHVPGIMLISGLLDLVAAAAPEAFTAQGSHPVSRHHLRTGLWFPRFCELDEATELRACPSSPNAWAVQASQARGPVCLGSVDVYDADQEPADQEPADQEPADQEPAGPAEPGAPGLDGEPADVRFVHRARPENVLVSRIVEQDDGTRLVALLSSHGAARFTARTGDVRSPEELIEAARQVATMVWSCEYGFPADVLLTLNRLEADVPVAVHRGRPVGLRWKAGQPRGTKAQTGLELVDLAAAPGTIGRITMGRIMIGRITIESQAWTGEQWRRLRAERR
jgi:hypothetical protein